MKKIILLKTLSTGAFALVVLAGTSSFFLSSTAKAYDASTTSLSRCKEVKELWDQGDFTARFGSEAVREGGACRALYFGKGWNVNIHHNTDSRRTLEYCRKIKEIFADEGNWTPRFGGIEEPFKCKTLYYTQNWREKSTSTQVTCYTSLPNGGGQCEKKAVEDCPLHLSFDNNDDCWKRHGQSNPSLSRCKEVKELWDQGNFTARFGNAGVLEGGVCRARYFGKGWNVNIHHNTDSRRTLEYCRKIKEIFADEGNWTPRFGGIEEPFKCKTLYYTQNWREKSTATLVNCYAPFSNGGGRCMEEAKEDCASQYTFRSNADCQNYLERKSDTISCCKKFSAGVACEQYPSTDSCADWGGEVYSSCNECFAERDPEPETISCCKKFSSGVSCEQYPSTDSCADWGGVVYSSCNECFAGHDPLPPAGYEDEVLVNFDAYDNPFPDTSLSTLEGRASAELYRRAVIGGFPDGEFKGDRPVNRAEAAKFLLLARFGEISNVSNSGRFPDVLDGQWYTKYVVTAANKGIISGHPDGTFKPADGVNTAEFLKMLTLTFDLQTNLPFSYRDVSSSDWFSQYAGIAKKYNLFPDRTSYLSPARALTRSEVSVAIYQFLQGR